MPEQNKYRIGQIWMTDINPTGGSLEGKHPIVILDINYDTNQIILGNDLTIIVGTSKEKSYTQVVVEPTETNGLSKVTYFNISPAWKINSFELDYDATYIGILEEIYFNEIMDEINNSIK